MKLDSKIQGKKIIITGASSGIGKSAAIQLAHKGAEVVLVARREDELNEVVKTINSFGGKAHAYNADLSNLDADPEKITIQGEDPSRLSRLI